jgi:hypothetical protein
VDQQSPTSAFAPSASAGSRGWDIFYYVFLRLISGPKTLLDWDILFLLPLPWWGPVLAPVSMALVSPRGFGYDGSAVVFGFSPDGTQMDETRDRDPISRGEPGRSILREQTP